MGLQFVQYSEIEEVDITCERDEWSDNCTVVVRLNTNSNDEVVKVRWHGEGSGPLNEDEAQRAREAARRKMEES